MKRILYLLIALTFFSAAPLIGGSVPTMDKDELKSMLGQETLVVLDVRTGRDWTTSEFKIKGALRAEDGTVVAVKDYPKDHTFVLYCA